MRARVRVLLLLSLAVNAGLTIMLLKVTDDLQSSPDFQPEINPSRKARLQNKTNVVVRRQHFHWSELESNDFPTYIANLQRIGCPPETIRNIIVAEVNQLFEHRKATEIKTPEQQWWKPEPDAEILQSIAAQLQALEQERRALLTELLGPDWEPKPQVPTDAPIRFDGPVLSQLPLEVKHAVLRIERESQERTAAAMRERQDSVGSLDSADLARLREATRTELAKILPPDALEEYLLRYSYNASNLRQQLRGFETTPDEFRAIFRVRDNYDNQIALLGDSDDPATLRKRQQLERARDQAVSTAIAPDRLPLYVASQDPLFRAAQQQVEQSGAAAERVLPIYEIQQLARSEMARINNDQSLTEEEREVQIRAVERLQQASIDKVLNPPQ